MAEQKRQTQFPEDKSLAHETLDAVINAPMFMGEYIVSLAATVISDIYLFTVFLAALTVGYATRWEIGLATFFVLYTLLRLVGNIANAIGVAGQSVAGATANGMAQHAAMLTSPPPGVVEDEPLSGT